MKYYTEIIPLPLAEKLKEKGMFVEIVNDYDVEEWPSCGSCFCNTTYAEVFDWLMEKEINILIEIKKDLGNYFIPKLSKNDIFTQVNITPFGTIFWHEAATTAIEKALELI